MKLRCRFMKSSGNREYRCDFHIHSCLSPCGSDDMTPNNLVNMAALSGCEIIAMTDHNTCRNTPAAVRAGEEAGILVIPGMELCTAEEAHVVCLFETISGALEFGDYIMAHMPHVKNKPEIFGEQRILDEEDQLLGLEENLLLVSSFVGINEVLNLTEQYGGTAFPAHVDRDSYSVIASLGAIPPEAGFTAAEVTRGCDMEAYRQEHPELSGLLILRDSDSHYLETLADEPGFLQLEDRSTAAVLKKLRSRLG